MLAWADDIRRRLRLPRRFTTAVKAQITTSGRRTSDMLGQVASSIEEVQRPLLTPDQFLRVEGTKKAVK